MNLREMTEVKRLGLVVRAAGHLLDRQISWVHSTDLPDPSPYLSGGELILTGGLWHNSADDAERFVDSLVAAGVNGLGYGVKRLGGTVPDDVVKECDRRELPLIEIPFELPFETISQVFVENREQRSRASLEELLRNHETLAHIVAGGGGTRDLLAAMQERMSAAVWVVTGPGAWISTERLPFTADQIANIWKRVTDVGPIPPDQVRFGDPEIVATVMRINEKNEASAFLCYGTPASLVPSSERTLLQHSLRYLRIALVRARTDAELRARWANEVLPMLQTEPVNCAAVAERLKDEEVDVEHSMSLISALHDLIDDFKISMVIKAVRETFLSSGMSCLVASSPSETVAVVGTDSVSAVRDACSEILKWSRTALPGTRLFLGIAEPAKSAAELRRAYLHGGNAARYARAACLSRPIIHSELGSYRLLLAVDERIRESFRDLLLQPVVSYDRAHGTELLRTLEVFISNCCHWQRSSDALNIHTNTLRYRLSCVEELTGRDIRQMGDRVDFYLALAISTRD